MGPERRPRGQSKEVEIPSALPAEVRGVALCPAGRGPQVTESLPQRFDRIELIGRLCPP